jgi:hypothetical protein
MNRDELIAKGFDLYIEQNVESLGSGRDDDGFPIYSTEIEQRQISQIKTIAEQYADLKVSELKAEIEELRERLSNYYADEYHKAN